MPMMIATASRVGDRLIASGLSAIEVSDACAACLETVMVLVSEFPLMSTAVIVNWVS